MKKPVEYKRAREVRKLDPVSLAMIVGGFQGTGQADPAGNLPSPDSVVNLPAPD